MPVGKSWIPILAVFGTALCRGAAVQADVKPAALFGDKMVLQRGVKVPIWGTADAGEKVRVSFAGQEKSGTAGADGKWMVQLAPLSAEGKSAELVIAGKNTVTLHNVAVGEVWLCSGQSNMEVSMNFVLNAGKEIQAANNPDLRLFTVKRAADDAAAADVAGNWSPATPDSVKPFSGTAYYFGRALQQKLKVPVGIVMSAWAGSYIESWISPAAIKADADYPAIQGRWQKGLDHFPAAMEEFKAAQAKYEADAAQAKAEGKPAPRVPFDPLHSPGMTGPAKAALIFDQAVEHYAIPHPAGLYNGMIAPLVPFAFAGVAWYQGESNFTRSEQYKRLFPLMIQDWRRAWDRADWPFVYVQLPNIGNRVPGHTPPVFVQWAEIREAQQVALSLPRTGMAVAIDLGDGDIHPHDKAAIGGRLADAALGVAYGQAVDYASPLFEAATVEAGKMRVRLKGDVKGLKTKDGGAVTGFALAGVDKKWNWAQAEIDGESLVVHSEAVPQPVAVRYLWDANPEVNLVNGAGLPVAPFRSDWVTTGSGKK